MKKRVQKTDGLGPHELKKIRSALRLVWHRSYARALVVKRCTGRDGFTYCERCHARTPKLKIDHIEPVGNLPGMIERMFVPSSKLQGWCNHCHLEKTRQERRQARLNAKLAGYL